MAKVKPLDDEDILGFIEAPSNETNDNKDPVTKSKVVVTLDQLQPYVLNPRKTKNPNYDEIRDSIEMVGLKQVPVISRRNPEDERFTVRDGGNTRLEILNELLPIMVQLPAVFIPMSLDLSISMLYV